MPDWQNFFVKNLSGSLACQGFQAEIQNLNNSISRLTDEINVLESDKETGK